MAMVYIGIGSNLGERHQNCVRAVECLEGNGLRVLRWSTMQETAPWGLSDQPAFVNMAVAIETDRDPQALLVLLKKIEREMGRRDSERWGPRIIDLDILLYDDIIMNTGMLTIPHPLIQEREFVLMPLSEIAADLTHPVLKRTIGELYGTLKAVKEGGP